MAFTAAFFTGYRRVAVEKDEVLVSVTIPFTKEVGNFVIQVYTT